MDLNAINKDVVTRKFEWIIDKASLMKISYLLSQNFDVILENGRTKWQLVLYSNRYALYAQLKKVESSLNDYVVDLKIETNSRIEVDKTVKKQFDGQNFDSWFNVLYVDHIFSTLLELKIEISLVRNKASDCLCAEPIRLLSNYEKLFNTEKLSDFKFICADRKKIPAHRFVLIAHSPVMYNMLMTPMKESKTNSAKLDDIDSELMLEVLRFLYTGRVENIETFAPELLYCAEKYELNDLKTYAALWMSKNLTVQNALDYYTFADRYDEQHLLGKCVVFLKNNYEALKEHEQWNDFDPKIKKFLQYFVTNGSENEVYVLKTLKTCVTLPAGYILFR